MDSIPQKACTRCGQVRPLSDFQKRADSQDGHAHWCKACQATYDRQNRDRKNARHHERYTTDPAYREKTKARKRERYATDEAWRAQYILKAKRWQQENKERVNAGARKRYPTYKLTPQARDNKRKKKYLRRAREKNAGSFTEQEWQALCQFYDHRCLRCGGQFSLEELTRDHVVPLSKRGWNTIDNIQPLCMDCNREKQDRTADYRTIVQLRMEWEG